MGLTISIFCRISTSIDWSFVKKKWVSSYFVLFMYQIPYIYISSGCLLKMFLCVCVCVFNIQKKW